MIPDTCTGRLLVVVLSMGDQNAEFDALMLLHIEPGCMPLIFMLIQACQHRQHTFWTAIKGAGSGASQCQRVALQWQRPLVMERDSTSPLRRLQGWWL